MYVSPSPIASEASKLSAILLPKLFEITTRSMTTSRVCFLFLSILNRITRPRDYSLVSRQTKLEGPGPGAFVIGFLVIICVVVCLKRYADLDVVETTQNFVMRLI